MNWDLGDLYASAKDPRIKKDLNGLLNRAKKFSKRFRGKIKSTGLSVSKLKSAFLEIENIYQELEKILSFAFLLVATDTSNEEFNALMEGCESAATEIKNLLLFFDLELFEISSKKMNIFLRATELKNYKHYLALIKKQKPFHLTEQEEKVLNEKAETSTSALQDLFQKLVAEIDFEVSEKGKKPTKRIEEVLNFFHSPKRSLRKNAADALTEGLTKNGRQFTDLMNYLVKDKAKEDKMRRHKYPEESRHISNEISKEIVDTLEDVVVKNYGLAARYYNLKKKVLGLKKLEDYDRYAPIASDSAQKFSFKEAKQIVLEAYRNFSPEMANLAREFFDKKWIDSEVKKGKRGGAFCAGVTPDLHPYVLLNFQGSPRDVATLAHELGHGVHDMLSRKNSYFNFGVSLTIAETASVFGEMLVFESLLNKVSSKKERLALLMQTIEDMIATVFRQIAMFKFEERVHHSFKENGRIRQEDFNQWWREEHQKVFGDSLKLRDGHGCWWMYVSHIFQSPFYVYAYAFGELLTLSFYARYKNGEKDFSKKYIEFLSAGGSSSPDDLLKKIGANPKDPKFWQNGINLIAGLIKEAEDVFHS